MALTKRYLKSKPVCKVTFRLSRRMAGSAAHVHLVGEFNQWNILANPMKPLKKGGFTLTLDLEPGREYQFRYLIDQVRWENDDRADKYVATPFGDCDNSVVIV
ncbi:MAG: glycoside hydrolase [Deltaproteobacteria bacterium]|nr:MAG: glycoside hydrolase [Deltaproteobacteria bacterium]RUA02591.1 MAG: glycoside hydrolase [Deltaproteobacteria bacterium]